MSDPTLPAQSRPQAIPFRQKSSGLSLVILGSMGSYYAVRAFGLWQASSESVSEVPAGFPLLAVATLVLVIAVEAVLQAVLAIGAGAVPAPTQQDREVVRTAKGVAYGVLAVGVLVTFASLFLGATPFVMANLALFAFVLAEIAKFAAQLYLYGRSQ